MLSKADNELLCRVGPETAMGEVMRRYWIPALTSAELPAPNSDPLRVSLLGEDFVAFRDLEGKVGFLDEYCCHRGASLALGRVEEGGIRCIYHGWKFAADGTVLETPNVNDPLFKTRFKARSFPVREGGGLIWVYLGPREKQPPFREWHWFQYPDSNRMAVTYVVDCNYLQVLEGLLDSSHLTILHADVMVMPTPSEATATHHGKVKAMAAHATPDVEVESAEFGFVCAAVRPNPAGDGRRVARITSHATPFITLNPNGDIAMIVVPMSDTRTRQIILFWSPDERIGEEPLRTEHLGFVGLSDEQIDAFGVSFKECDRPGKPSRANNFHQDREAMRAGQSHSGLPRFSPEDIAVQVSSGLIRNRDREKLVPADAAIARVYQVLLGNVKRVQAGLDPTGVDVDASSIVGVIRMIEPGQSWQSLVLDHNARSPIVAA